MPATTPASNRTDFAQELGERAAQCSNTEWVLRQWNDLHSSYESVNAKMSSAAVKARNAFAVVAADCQAFLLKAPELFNDFVDMDEWARANNLSDDLDDFVIPFAMALDSDELTPLTHWIGEGLKVFQSVDNYPGSGGHPSRAQARARRVAMNLPYTDDEPNAEAPLNRPEFFRDGEFRNGFLHRQIFARQVEACVKAICDSSRHNVVETAKWVNLIHKATTESPSTGAVIKKELGEHLRHSRIEGLETLREYIIGRHTPTGQECSERAARLFGDMVYREIEPKDITDHLATLRLNDRYFSTLFFDELVSALADRCRHYNDNERGDEYDNGAQGMRQFRELFRQLDLTQQQLAKLAMTVTAKFSPGQQMDLSELSCVEQLDRVMEFAQTDSYVTLNPEGNLRHTVLSAVIHNLPQDMVVEIAQKRDASRMMMYTLTGKDVHLRGMKDNRLTDAVFSADLGL
ncbi:hypothetical protein [Pseudomonas sp. CFBP 13719]|nr:hypothetical protein [Pseudomonas sp. CFBP 13719]MBD8615506.1 hypothetical protein [Pseudomonas putida]MBD8681841.1 hypothetical protein [Pseudomonas sp. CFBP 13719]